MKIVLATYGSRGDVQPMIALCLALKSAGHDAMLVGPPEKALWAKALDCPYTPFGQDVTAFIDSKKNAISLRSGIDFTRLVQQSLKLQLEILPSFFRGADLIIGSSLMLGASTITELFRIPYRYIVFTPQLFPSKFHPFPIIKTQTLPHRLNAYSWRAASVADQLNFTWTINRFRRKAGLDSIKDAWDHILGEYPIAACDKVVAKIPVDIQIQVVQTGYLHLDFPGVLPPDLEEFLDDGNKPIYAGFGSMPSKDQKKNIPLFVQAARNVNKKIIMTAFWDGQEMGQLEKDVYFIEQEVPHRLLFPIADVIIHHGGAGTTATAALSGVPQIIVPHILDQYYHGEMIYRFNLGPKPVWRSNLTVQTITAALKESLFNPLIRQHAKQAGELIDPEKALQMAVKTIETF